MNDVQTEVRKTFADVAAGVTVPPFDEVAFRGRVRSGRRRRIGSAVGAVVVAASLAALAFVAVPPLVEDHGTTRDGAVAAAPTPTVSPRLLTEPLYYLAGMRLMAATPDGEVHDLGRFEEVVGFTAEGVLAIDTRSEPVWIAASSSGEGDGTFTFERDGGAVQLPDTGPVQGAVLSADGRFFAWLGLDDVVTVHDLKADAFRQGVQVGRNAALTSVSERGVLVSENGRLRLFEADGTVAVPTTDGGYGLVSDTVGEFVAVADRDDVTRLYDVTAPDARARLVDSVPGTGRLAPYARGIVTVDGAVVRLWTADGEPTVLDGLDGAPQSAGWVDEDHVVVTAAGSAGTSIYLCPVADADCTRVAFSEDDVRLAE